MAAITGLARLLLNHEAGEAENPQSFIEAAECACEKLRLHLSKRVGGEGFRTLLARALTLATVEFPALSAVRVRADGTLEGLSDAALSNQQEHKEEDGQESVEGAIALVGYLIGLLVTFIGEDLTLRMLGTVWPTFQLDDATVALGVASGREETP